MLSSEPKMISVHCPKTQRGLKNAKRPFSCKIVLRLKKNSAAKKLCYKVTLCENCPGESSKAFIGLSLHAKMIGGGRPLKYKFCIK